MSLTPDTVRAGIPVVGPLVRRQIQRMFGPPPLSGTAERGDPGLTGPGSPSWRVIAEPGAIAGGIRGLLVQIAHPHAMAGVADHSAYRDDPLGRLQRTSAWVTITTFGSLREAMDVTVRVRQIHRRVRGVAPDGSAYDASEPSLLAWVALALTSSFLAADRLWAPHPLDARDADTFVAEQSRIAALLDPRVDLTPLMGTRGDHLDGAWHDHVDLPLLTDGLLPLTVRALEDRLASYAPVLRLDPAGRDAVDFLHRPPLPRVPLTAYGILFAGVRASLSPAHRQVLGIDVRTAASDLRRARQVLRGLRRLTGSSPTERLAWARAGRGT
ncbi:MAG: oxygenase MpaB family protein [Nitriliruptoraceae bacterium]